MTVTFASADTTDATTGMYICFKIAVGTDFVAMPKYVANLADTTPTPLDLEPTKTVTLSGLATMHVGESIVLTVTAPSLPVSGSVTYTLGFVAPLYNSKLTISNTVTFTAGSSLTQTITITALAAIYGENIQLVPSGTAYEYMTSAASPVTVNMVVTVTAPPKARADNAFPIKFTLNEDPRSDVTVTPTASGVVFTPTSVTFTPGSLTALVMTSIAAPQTITVMYAVGGTDSASAIMNTASSSIVIEPLADVYMVGIPQALYTVPHAGAALFVSLSEFPFDTAALGTAATLVSATLTPSSAGIHLNSTVVEWTSVGPHLRQGVNLTATTAGTYHITLSLSGSESAQFQLVHSVYTVYVFAHKTFTTVAPPFVFAGGMDNDATLSVRVSQLPDNGEVTVTPVLTEVPPGANVSFYPPSLTWRNFTTTPLKHFNITANLSTHYTTNRVPANVHYFLLTSGEALKEFTSTAMAPSTLEIAPRELVNITIVPETVMTTFFHNITVSVTKPPRLQYEDLIVGLTSNVSSPNHITFSPPTVHFTTTGLNLTCSASSVTCSRNVSVNVTGYLGAIQINPVILSSFASSQYVLAQPTSRTFLVINRTEAVPFNITQRRLTVGTCTDMKTTLLHVPIRGTVTVTPQPNMSGVVSVTPSSTVLSPTSSTSDLALNYNICAVAAVTTPVVFDVALSGDAAPEYVILANTVNGSRLNTVSRGTIFARAFDEVLFTTQSPSYKRSHEIVVNVTRNPIEGIIKITPSFACPTCVTITPPFVEITPTTSNLTAVFTVRAMAPSDEPRAVTFSLAGTTTCEFYSTVNSTDPTKTAATSWLLQTKGVTATHEPTQTRELTLSKELPPKEITATEIVVKSLTCTSIPKKKSRTLTMSETENLVKDFYIQVSDNIDQITATRKTQLIGAFEAINPVLKGKVGLEVVGAGSAILRFVVLELSKQTWEVVKPDIQAADLSPVGVVSDVVPGEEAGKITESNAGSDITTCGTSATLAANAPTYGKGEWTSNSTALVIANRNSPTTMVTNLAEHENVLLTWKITNLQLSSASSMVLRRISVPSRVIQVPSEAIKSSVATIHLASSEPLGAAFEGEWSITDGSGEIMTSTANSTNVSAAGIITLQYTVRSSMCTLTSVSSASITFPILTKCNSTTCVHGTCNEDQTCTCHSSATLGYFKGLSCSECQAGFSGPKCLTSTCVEGTASCVHGTCKNSECECHHSAALGHWSGKTCSVCASSSTNGFWTGSKCDACQDGFSGEKCLSICVASLHCSGHGVCGATGCECFASDTLGYWAGEKCDKCVGKYFGDKCNTLCYAATTCNGHGTCESGCKCYSDADRGFWTSKTSSSSYCDQCQDGFSGTSCLVNSKSTCSIKTCSSGVCDANGNCKCFANDLQGYWAGTNCDKCRSASIDGFFGGERCKECQRGYWGTNCDIACPNNKCGGHGSCGRTSGLCVCDTPTSPQSGRWDAATGCPTCVQGYYGAQCNVACDAATCGSHGECNENDGTCACHSNTTHGYWTGTTCSNCLNMRSTESMCLSCLAGVHGVQCNVWCDAQLTCNGHGTCSSSTGACICHSDTAKGFWGGSLGKCEECQTEYTGDSCRTNVGDSYVLPDVCGGRSQVADVLRIQFTEAFNQLMISFNTTTDMANTYRSNLNRGLIDDDCSHYFDASTITTFGLRPVCQWSSATALVVQLGFSFTINVGDPIKLRPYTVLAIDGGSSTLCSMPFVFKAKGVQLPERVRTPVAMLKAPASVRFCTDIRLDGSASFRSSPRLLWKYALDSFDMVATGSTSLKPSDVQTVVDATLAALSETTQAVSLPASITPPGTYRFKLTVIDDCRDETQSAVVAWSAARSAHLHTCFTIDTAPSQSVGTQCVRSVRRDSVGWRSDIRMDCTSGRSGPMEGHAAQHTLALAASDAPTSGDQLHLYCSRERPIKQRGGGNLQRDHNTLFAHS